MAKRQSQEPKLLELAEKDKEQVEKVDQPRTEASSSLLTPQEAANLLVRSMKLVLMGHPHPLVSIPAEVDVFKLALAGKQDNDPIWASLSIIHDLNGRQCFEICKALAGPQIMVPDGSDS